MARIAELERNTNETQIRVVLALDGRGSHKIETGIPFFDHMLTLFTVHGLFDLQLQASGDIEVDFHHTVEDVGLLLGEAVDAALGDRAGIHRYGHAVTPMDDALCAVTIDLSKRPFFVYRIPSIPDRVGTFDTGLTREFLRGFSVKGGMNLHVNVNYGEDGHHVLESIFKSLGRALNQAVSPDHRFCGVRSSKGKL
jgi:imidazoleglycerol-phosphate dehydratase